MYQTPHSKKKKKQHIHKTKKTPQKQLMQIFFFLPVLHVCSIRLEYCYDWSPF